MKNSDHDKKCCALRWLFSSDSQGFGTILIGIAALIALSQTSSVIDNILKIQEQAKDIKSVVEKVSTAVNDLSELMRQNRSEGFVRDLPENLNDKELDKALRSLVPQPNQTKAEYPTVYLPEAKLDSTKEQLLKAPSKQERIDILKKALDSKFDNEKISPVN